MVMMHDYDDDGYDDDYYDSDDDDDDDASDDDHHMKQFTISAWTSNHALLLSYSVLLQKLYNFGTSLIHC